jgi:hypothetical protein
MTILLHSFIKRQRGYDWDFEGSSFNLHNKQYNVNFSRIIVVNLACNYRVLKRTRQPRSVDCPAAWEIG